MKKRNMVLVALLALLLGLAAYGTVAYFAGEAHTTNVITTGTVDVELVETWNPEDGKNVMPGQTVSKKVEVKNIGTGDAWVRVHVATTATDAQKQPLDVALISLVGTDVTDEAGQQVWVPGEGGWYYYYEPLAPGAMTALPLFTAVKFDAAMDNEFQGATIQVAVSAQGVQSKNNPIPEGGDVTAIPGWPTN